MGVTACARALVACAAVGVRVTFAHGGELPLHYSDLALALLRCRHPSAAASIVAALGRKTSLPAILKTHWDRMRDSASQQTYAPLEIEGGGADVKRSPQGCTYASLEAMVEEVGAKYNKGGKLEATLPIELGSNKARYLGSASGI